MIPIQLSLSGFLSYREAVEIDFTTFELACISGPNGAGKSSLLDAITWGLFGQARKRDDSIINNQSSTAEIALIFAYESNIYHVQRTKRRDRTTLLEFHILQDSDRPEQEGNSKTYQERISSGVWKPLTECTLRETEACIKDTLRMDYETFTNASFFLQGKADQFTQQRSGDRKRILSSILGLDVWEVYRQRASERRRNLETEISGVNGRMGDLVAELSEEESRKHRLGELEEELERLSKQRIAQESVLVNMRQFAATLEEQQRLVDTLERQLEKANLTYQAFSTRLTERLMEHESYIDAIKRAEQIKTSYEQWIQMRDNLELFEQTAQQFRQYDKRREGPRSEIQSEKARLEQERSNLEEEQIVVRGYLDEIKSLQSRAESVRASLLEAEARFSAREQLVSRLGEAQQRQTEARTENPRLKAEMDELKDRIDSLEVAEGANCPLCGQPLSPAERTKLVEELSAEGTKKGDRFRENQKLLQEANQHVAELESQINNLATVAEEVREGDQQLAGLTGRIEMLDKRVIAWQEEGKPRLEQVEDRLVTGKYALEAREQLTVIDGELKAIGYDAVEHEKLRKEELDARTSEDELRKLEAAQAALEQLEREISDLEGETAALGTELEQQGEELQKARESLHSAQSQMPDIRSAEREYLAAQERENRLRLEVGAARQEVLVLDDLRLRHAQLEAQREQLADQASRYQQLERAFGKDGVPALLIEQALPEIEMRANEVLERLSGGNMSVRFITQAEYKDKKRVDLRETLDIRISDSAGVRDYEMFSGGEAFRVNFAIRLALSEVLAQRAGARLQMLVIDEGFGSQDEMGRQRLVEAINQVKADFAKILVITHIEELKDAFPNRIEVEKTARGSVVQVV